MIFWYEQIYPPFIDVYILKMGPLSGLRYCKHAGNEIAIISTAPPPVIEIAQNHKGYDFHMPSKFLLWGS